MARMSERAPLGLDRSIRRLAQHYVAGKTEPCHVPSVPGGWLSTNGGCERLERGARSIRSSRGLGDMASVTTWMTWSSSTARPLAYIVYAPPSIVRHSAQDPRESMA